MKYLSFIFLLACGTLSALYMGNPAEPQIIDKGFWISPEAAFGLKVGYQGDRVADRKMHTHKGRIDDMELSMDQGVLTLGYLDRIEIYGSVGSINGSFSNRFHSDSKRRQYETEDGCTVGTGGRFLLAQWGGAVIGIDGKAQWGNPSIHWMAVDGVSKNTRGHLRYCEWQASFALSYTVSWLTPYLGVKYSNVHARVSGIPKAIYSHTRFSMVNRCRFGLAIGCTLCPGNKFDLFAEAQLIDEQALSFGGTLKF